MKFKVVLSSILVLGILFASVVSVYAKVDNIDQKSGSYGSNIVFKSASDYYGGASSSVKAIASAAVNGHDAAGVYQYDGDSDSI